MRVRVSPLQRALLLTLLASGALIGACFGFRYAAVAQFREAILPIDTQDAVTYGEALFQTRGCVGCHTLERAGSVGDE